MTAICMILSIHSKEFSSLECTSIEYFTNIKKKTVDISHSLIRCHLAVQD